MHPDLRQLCAPPPQHHACQRWQHSSPRQLQKSTWATAALADGGLLAFSLTKDVQKLLEGASSGVRNQPEALNGPQSLVLSSLLVGCWVLSASWSGCTWLNRQGALPLCNHSVTVRVSSNLLG